MKSYFPTSFNSEKIFEKMIEYIVKIYGINCKNKWIGYLTTGLTLSIFLSLAFPVIYAKNSSNKTNEFFFILLMSTFCASKILNYLAIKYNSSNLFHLN
jgi:glutamate/tyrosine decarboxylase-like PLP-dependent enzyme